MTTYSDVRPGDRLVFERPGGVVYGGAVWQSPTTGDILAGDTFLTLAGKWLEDPTGDVQMTLDTSRRRDGETWKITTVAGMKTPVEPYTPDTAEIRAAWLDSHRVDAEGGGFEREGRPRERIREFDRWFLQEIERAEYSGYLRAVREGLHR